MTTSNHLLQVLEKVFSDYQMNEVFLSFNGGKDCTLLLHLVTTFLQKHFKTDAEQQQSQESAAETRLFCIHVQSKCPFDEIEKFVEQCQQQFSIKMKTVKGDIKSALKEQCKENSNLKACLMGCRRTDPHCSELNVFQVTIFLFFQRRNWILEFVLNFSPLIRDGHR